MPRLPLIAPQPPRLSELGDALRRVEASGLFSNNGPEARAFEAEATEQLFDGKGACLAVANATLGLMLAIRDAVGEPEGRYALMPAMTFAATAEAAYWAGLTPLVCDIDPGDWSASAAEEERLLAAYGDRIAVVIPYATFGYGIDLDRYARLAERHGLAVVIDAAASLGTTDAEGGGFGAGAPFPVVFSMHATKPFATAEGGLVHCGDAATIERLRAMANFGFERPRTATLPGLNAKLPEVLAVMARAKLAEFAEVTRRRTAVAEAYRGAIAGRYGLQPAPVGRQAMGFQPVVLPPELAPHRDAIGAALDAQGVGNGRYFSPHLGQQPWIRQVSLVEPTPVTDRIGDALVTLPLTDAMTPEDARDAVAALDRACEAVRSRPLPAEPRAIDHVLIVGGGPAGTAMLTAASKHGRLADLARAGLTIVERDTVVGNGRLGRYAITSDSTAHTFLTAVADNPHPEIAALANHPAARGVARYKDALGVPLVEAGPLLRVTGERLAGIVSDNGGRVLTGHEVLWARQADGLWQVRLRCLADNSERTRLARNLVIATGGHQPLDRLAAQQVAGAPLVAQAGDRLIQSDEVLAVGGFEKVADLLSGRRAPRIVVVGGSTSALTTVALLLKGRPALPLGAGAITLLHRRPIRPFYPSVDAAHAEGFTDFSDDDICPVSGFVYRLAGFRLEARDLVLRMLGVDGRVPDPRVTMHRIKGEDAEARHAIARADLVIAALGYRPRALPLERADGAPLVLAAHDGRPMVDRHCRVTDAEGQPVLGLYGIGLAAGFVPWGRLGGEASFSGQANGLWLWQNDVGMMIVDQLLGAEARAAA
ncbi:DegT/DnrJ/EryC1/StrS family aminotransferase [Sphingomonas sp.]|uniref:DegT/DnrJ/EryC1/StrS family aminotransferase n=1 Tax=Sphingomonas sp. TaxID=28214 RepID=UPI0035C8758C